MTTSPKMSRGLPSPQSTVAVNVSGPSSVMVIGETVTCCDAMISVGMSGASTVGATLLTVTVRP